MNTYMIHDAIDAMKNYRKIDAIKSIRAFTGVGLKEAKDLVEALIPYIQKEDVPASPYTGEGEHVVVRQQYGETYLETYYSVADAVRVAGEYVDGADSVVIARVTHKVAKSMRAV